MMEGFSCTYQAILNDVPLQIWEAITTDGPSATPLWVTRAFHNKPVFYFLNYARCYFHYLSPKFLSDAIGPIGTIILVIAVCRLWKSGGTLWKIIRWFIILYPIVFLFELQRGF